MKSTLLYLLMCMMFVATVSFRPKPCGKYQGRNIYKGEKGGCFYLKGKKKVKVYINKAFCKC